MSNTQRDFSIDFIKGIAALSVIFLHNMPNHYIGSIVWIGQAVPLFLFVTAYLTYGSFQRGKTINSYYSKNSILKIFNRIFKPFLIMTLVQYSIYCFIRTDFSIINVIRQGGLGPGSYYPWLYLQAWITLPFIIMVINKLSFKKSALLFILICISLELISSIIQIPAYIYRLTFYRYLFVFYLACVVQKYDIKISKSLISLACISLGFLLIMFYTDINLEPIFYNNWRGYHWLSYFYTTIIFLLLIKAYSKIKESKSTQFFILLGNFSYEIFLCQMFVYSLLSLHLFTFLGNIYLVKIAFIITSTTLSIAPVLIYKLYIKPLLYKRGVKDKYVLP